MREADHTHIASPTPSGPRVSRRTALTALGALGALAATPTLAGPAAATTYPNPNNTPTSAIRTYGDMIKGLEQLQRTSRGTVTVTTLREVGTAELPSEQGRELYVATVGTGARHLWIQGRIHGDEPYGLDSLMTVLKSLVSSGNPTYRQIREQFTIHFIPVYNPDGSEMNTRTTTLWDETTNQPRLGANGRPLTVDLNRDWAVNGFRARESRAWYEYWTMVKPEYALDIHHQGMKVDRTTGEAITLSLGVSLAPGGPTLPGIRGGEYDVLTRQMAGHVWQQVDHRGHITTDRYDVGEGVVIDIHGGVVSAMMMGLNWNGLNPTGHSNAAIFFETSGNTRDGSLGQKARGKLIQQNVLGVEAWLSGLATGAVQRLDPEIWEQIPHDPVQYYFTDWGGTIPA
ncbi:M14 family zinc carboxypeptidase [Micrococcus terreus]|uniref:M14 family zinc carboxypeptidase n=1 Tax=Micrococcus terreus TaxID=574650 RepID=UPI00254B0DE3|nr:M14 family zinc carboxypeptidase [Micrococcus terreus]MDK7701382.1 M14 family zinc carboxypeptidase [Micrococcus terreus]WOO98058.1 M14 family zinc carboxypeptidase [Micrococcus terreus]